MGLCYREFVGLSGRGGGGSDQGKQHKIKDLNMNSRWVLYAFVKSNDMLILRLPCLVSILISK